jgi:aryl-alcohol dehydrogenase-like predicted oxidoreductase
MSSSLPDNRLSQWAIRWILDHPQVTTVIPGATKVEQVEKNMAASDLPQLSKSTHQPCEVCMIKR